MEKSKKKTGAYERRLLNKIRQIKLKMIVGYPG